MVNTVLLLVIAFYFFICSLIFKNRKYKVAYFILAVVIAGSAFVEQTSLLRWIRLLIIIPAYIFPIVKRKQQQL